MNPFLNFAGLGWSKHFRARITASKLSLLLFCLIPAPGLRAQVLPFSAPSAELRGPAIAEKADASTNAPANLATNISKNVPAQVPTNAVAAPITNATPEVAMAAAATTAASQDTNYTLPAPGPGQLPLPDIVSTIMPSNQLSHIEELQVQLDLAREQRRQKNAPVAAQTLLGILHTNAPPELHRLALFELALVNQDDNQLVKAQQIFSQYLHMYPDDPSVPEVLLRQGLIYRQMGVTTLAVSKFYAVMSTALKLKLDNMDYYKKLVLQAQMEIADTYYLEGKYEESADYFSRLLKDGASDLNKTTIQYKLIRSLSFLTNHIETVAKSQVFLDTYTNSAEVPEVRFLLASALKKLGRNSESMKQVLLLLQSQQENVRKNPETWIYWQERAGNDIANQLYKEGDYMNALQIYVSLADLDKSPAWQLPVWYQTGLVYEQLQQWQKATETYQNILDRQKELTDAVSTPSLQSLLEMAKWRKDYLDWMQKAKITNQSFQPNPTNSPATVATK
jgi:tetratricopeptide (TPR) repeat protein